MEPSTCGSERSLLSVLQSWVLGPRARSYGSNDGQLSAMAEVVKCYRGVSEEEPAVAWVDKPAFELAFSVLVVLNLLTIGLETDLWDGKGRPLRDWPGSVWLVLEMVFCLLFDAEVALKLLYHGPCWVFGDVCDALALAVAVVTTVDLCVLLPLRANGTLRLFSLLRLVRMTRVLRVLNAPAFKELKLVLQGLVNSFRMLSWSLLILVVIVYVCAVFATVVVGREYRLYGDYRKMSGGWDHLEYFGTVRRSMLTLTQVITLDEWSSGIARHVLAKQPLMSLFFLVFLILTTFGMLNLVIGVVTEQLLTASRQDAAKARMRDQRSQRSELETMQEIFNLADEEGSGELSRHSFLKACQNPEVSWRMRQLELDAAAAMQLFSTMSGEATLSVHEFIDACARMKGPAMSKDMLALQARADVLASKMDQLGFELQDGERLLGTLDEITTRMALRFVPTIKASSTKLARTAGGAQPLVPPKKERVGEEAPLSIGNRPALPRFPDFLK